jgi:hypothetical protein
MSYRLECPRLLRIFTTLMLVYLTAGAFAATSFYVDPKWKGAQSGTQQQPWQNLSTAAWSAINSALQNNDVNVFFSARNADGSSMIYDANGDGVQDGIDVNSRTAATAFKLGFDGKTIYNSGTTTPAWVTNSTPTMCTVRWVYAQNPEHKKRSNIRVFGFRILTDSVSISKFVSICGDNWEVSDCDMSHTSNATDGPGILLVPTSDSAHEGSSYFAPPCTNIVIRNNYVHDTCGEAIYIGGGGTNPGEAGSGYPSHSGILVEGNRIYNAGIIGDQGDGIDIKGGLTDLIVRGNEIYGLGGKSFSGAVNQVRGIVMQGQLPNAQGRTIIERNKIHDCTGLEDAAIAVVNSWGTPNHLTIRNNIIYNISGTVGIKVYGVQDTLTLYNNTIFNCASMAVYVQSAGGIQAFNNLFFNNNSGSRQVQYSATSIESNYNAYTGSSGVSGEGSSSLQLSSSQLSSAFPNLASFDVRPSPAAVFVGKGRTIADFSDDFEATPRGSVWDMGAISAPKLLPPGNLRRQ